MWRDLVRDNRWLVDFSPLGIGLWATFLIGLAVDDLWVLATFGIGALAGTCSYVWAHVQTGDNGSTTHEETSGE